MEKNGMAKVKYIYGVLMDVHTMKLKLRKERHLGLDQRYGLNKI